MSLKNIKITSPNNKLNSPYYISDIKLEILKKLGINNIILEKINNYKDLPKSKVKYYNIFKAEIDSEIEIFFNIINIDEKLDIYNSDINEHVNNLNELIELVYKMLNKLI